MYIRSNCFEKHHNRIFFNDEKKLNCVKFKINIHFLILYMYCRYKGVEYIKVYVKAT